MSVANVDQQGGDANDTIPLNTIQMHRRPFAINKKHTHAHAHTVGDTD